MVMGSDLFLVESQIFFPGGACSSVKTLFCININNMGNILYLDMGGSHEIIHGLTDALLTCQ